MSQLWFNKYTLIEKQSFLFPVMSNNDLYHVGQVFDDDDDDDDDEWLTDKKRLALFLAATIVRGPYHRESQTHQEQEKLKIGKLSS